MPIIVPTITAENAHVYRDQIERVQGFAPRIHIDLMDGIFTPNKSTDVASVWWPEEIEADIHIMYQKPQDEIEALIKLKPRAVIIHAESDADIPLVAGQLNAVDIACGLVVFPETTIESVKGILPFVQQLLIFSGNLGHQGGSVANLDLLSKVNEAKLVNPELEIAWDGGVNKENIAQLAAAGVDVINVGGAVQLAPDAGLAYNALKTLLP